MRLLIKLRSIENSKYEMQYHYHLQGFIYNLLKGSKYHYIHNKEGYKFFCFSNIFPATKNLERNDVRSLIISSPNSEFIGYLYNVLQQPWNEAGIKTGHMKFRIDHIDKLVQKIPNNMPVTLITGTPIIVRIPSEKYREYEIEPKKEYEYIYWRSEYPIDLFVSQVKNNLLRKYTEYYEQRNTIKDNELMASLPKQSSFSLFQKFKFKKQVSTRVFIKGFEQVVIGTIWEFSFNKIVNENIVQFALDVGLGERNSLGFGFMNHVLNN